MVTLWTIQPHFRTSGTICRTDVPANMCERVSKESISVNVLTVVILTKSTSKVKCNMSLHLKMQSNISIFPFLFFFYLSNTFIVLLRGKISIFVGVDISSAGLNLLRINILNMFLWLNAPWWFKILLNQV